MPLPRTIGTGRALLGRAGGAITYLLRDLFGTPESAPIGSPRVCAPGPGTLTTVDTGSKISITAAGLRYASQTVSQTDPITKDSVTYARVAGRTFRVTTTAFRARLGWAQSGSNSADAVGMTHASGGIFVLDGLTTRGPLFTLVDSTQYTLECVMRDQGGMLFITGGAYATRTLLWVESGVDHSDLTTSPLRAMLGYSNTGVGAITATDWQEIDYGGAWGARFGLATDYQLYATAPITLNANADCLIEVVWFITTNEVLEIRFRRTDDDNCWLLRCTQADSTVKLFTRIAGVETEFSPGKTRTFSNASRQRITIRCEGTRIITATAGIVQHNVTDSYNTSVGGMKVSGTTYIPMADTWPLTGFVEPAQTSLPKNMYSYGDSKSGGSGDSTPPPLGYGGFPPLLIASLTSTTSNGWYERPYRIGHAGQTVAQIKAAVDADIAGAIGTPDYILVNMGINDTAPIVVDQATWQSNYGYVLDALHTKWPNAIIRVARVWGIGRDSDCNTLATWLDGVLATRSWAAVGLDERIVLKGSDNGASEMNDSVHPNRLGYTVTAAAWKVSMGV